VYCITAILSGIGATRFVRCNHLTATRWEPLLPTEPFPRNGRHTVTNAWGNWVHDKGRSMRFPSGLNGPCSDERSHQRSRWITRTSKQLTWFICQQLHYNTVVTNAAAHLKSLVLSTIQTIHTIVCSMTARQSLYTLGGCNASRTFGFEILREPSTSFTC
jgi:hypothetical protein